MQLRFCTWQKFNKRDRARVIFCANESLFLFFKPEKLYIVFILINKVWFLPLNRYVVWHFRSLSKSSKSDPIEKFSCNNSSRFHILSLWGQNQPRSWLDSICSTLLYFSQFTVWIDKSWWLDSVLKVATLLHVCTCLCKFFLGWLIR